MKELKETGALHLDIAGDTDVVLTSDDLLIETAQSEDYVTEQDNEVTVVLEIKLTPELIEEGFVNELISKVQTMRKEADFQVMDRIVVYAKGNEKIEKILSAHKEEIESAVLANDIVLGSTSGYEKEWNINGEKVTMAVEKQ